jgi:hypothetical protein
MSKVAEARDFNKVADLYSFELPETGFKSSVKYTQKLSFFTTLSF